jgi:DNA repair protein RadD
MQTWLTAEEASEYLGIGMSSLYALSQEGKVPGSRVGKKWRFNRDDLDAWLRAQRPIDEFFVLAEASIDDNPFLRDPQKDGHKAAVEYFARGGTRAILQLPVGCGKTGLIAIAAFGNSRGRVLVIAPNLTIRDELQKALDVTNPQMCFWRKCRVLDRPTLTAGPYVAVLSAKDANLHDCDNSHFVLTNIQQLASSADRWLPAFPDDYFDLILVDEGHHNAAASWKKVFERFPRAKVLSLTATPFRSDNQDVEGELVYRYSFKQAMLKGYIKRLQAIYVAPDEIHFTYEGDTRHHTLEEVLELKEEEWFSRGVALSTECNKHIVDASLEKLEKMRESGTRHQLIAVACSVAHAKAIRSLYAERGYEAAEIHSNMSEDKRAEVLQKLRAGILDCIVQVQILGEGFDHPHLSVAAIFRPFRSLAPYVQFVGRIMRVVVQNDPHHPDNRGFVVSHIGLNIDRQLSDFREIERDDRAFFEDLVGGRVPDEPPTDVESGDARQKLRESMVVNSEIVSEFFEEEFISSEDEALVANLAAHAESLGLDPAVVKALAAGSKASLRRVTASEDFAVIPQRQRQEARRRLNEEVKRTAKLLINRLELTFGGNELAFKYGLQLTGNNFVAAVQLVNKELDRRTGWAPGQRSTLRTEDYQKGIQSLSDILDTITRRLKRREEE